MRANIQDGVLFLQAEDVPHYKQRGSVVRNNYFWALRSIAARSPLDKPWEFESEVWFALCRMLVSFFESGYLGIRETQLEFLEGTEVPGLLRPVATWVAEFDQDMLLDRDSSGDSSDSQNPEDEDSKRPIAQATGVANETNPLDPGNDPAKAPRKNPSGDSGDDPNNRLATGLGKDTSSATSSPRRRASRSTRLG